jgi:hypothetical protein
VPAGRETTFRERRFALLFSTTFQPGSYSGQNFHLLMIAKPGAGSFLFTKQYYPSFPAKPPIVVKKQQLVWCRKQQRKKVA